MADKGGDEERRASKDGKSVGRRTTGCGNPCFLWRKEGKLSKASQQLAAQPSM